MFSYIGRKEIYYFFNTINVQLDLIQKMTYIILWYWFIFCNIKSKSLILFSFLKKKSIFYSLILQYLRGIFVIIRTVCCSRWTNYPPWQGLTLSRGSPGSVTRVPGWLELQGFHGMKRARGPRRPGSVPFGHVNIDHSPDWPRCNWPRCDWLRWYWPRFHWPPSRLTTVPIDHNNIDHRPDWPPSRLTAVLID